MAFICPFTIKNMSDYLLMRTLHSANEFYLDIAWKSQTYSQSETCDCMIYLMKYLLLKTYILHRSPFVLKIAIKLRNWDSNTNRSDSNTFCLDFYTKVQIQTVMQACMWLQYISSFIIIECLPKGAVKATRLLSKTTSLILWNNDG